MKVQVIPLVSYDTLTSVKDKISLAKAKCVVLNEQDSSAFLEDVIRIKLLKRFVQKISKNIHVISRNPKAIKVLEDEGITVLPDLATVQEYKWDVAMDGKKVTFPSKKTRSTFTRDNAKTVQNPNWLRLLSFGFGLAAVLVLFCIFAPSAEIKIHIPIVDQEIQIPFYVNSKTKFTDTALIKLEPVTVEAESFNSISVSGQALFPDTTATGEIELANLTEVEVVIPGDLVLVSSVDASKQYKIIRSETIPAGVGATVTIPIEAIYPGEKGNAGINELSIVMGVLGLRVSASNPSEITGGKDVKKAYPSPEDRNQLRALCIEQIKKSALQKLKNDVNDKFIILPATIEISKVLSENFYPPDPQPTDTLSLTIRAEVIVQTINKDIFATYSQPYLDALIPRGHSPAGSIRVTGLQIENINPNGSIKGLLDVSRPYKQDINIEKIKMDAAGQLKTTFVADLTKKYKLQDSVQIATFPGWIDILPFVPFRIKVSEAANQ
jgi:hypothetical protein